MDDAYLDRLRRALSCLTTTVLIRRSSGDDPPLRRTELARAPASLRGDRSLGLTFSLVYALQSDPGATNWRIHTLGYRYDLNDDEGAELLAYHWHPYGHSPVVEPHLHVSNRHPSIDLSKVHLPTGYVSPEAFVRCLITEFGVEPLRPDWRAILADA